MERVEQRFHKDNMTVTVLDSRVIQRGEIECCYIGYGKVISLIHPPMKALAFLIWRSLPVQTHAALYFNTGRDTVWLEQDGVPAIRR